MASDKDKTQTVNRPYSGTSASDDPTTMEGQYPPGNWGTALFGGPLDGSGAPGSQGATGASGGSTIMAGQNSDGLTGVTDAEITQTGAPGSHGAQDIEGGGTALTYTKASDGIGPYEQVSMTDEINGPSDWTGANDQGYGTGGPQLPGIKGNEPGAGGSRYQPGGGRVMRGGRLKGQ